MPVEYNFSDILVIDDDKEQDLEIMRSIIESKNQENAFYIVDVARIVKQHKDWIRYMPRVVPYYAVKCNPDQTVIKTLAALNCCFDCASQREIEQIIETGVPADRIIFANPAKISSHIKYAKKVGVYKMTVDSKEEVMKIKDIFPDAKLFVRICNDGIINVNNEDMTLLGEKFGCESKIEAKNLVDFIKNIGMSLHGFSFHSGSPCRDTLAVVRGIEKCKKLIKYARSIGCQDAKIIDIGGGFIGLNLQHLEDTAKAVNDTLKDVDESIEIMSEPGRYYVETGFTLAALVHSKKRIKEKNVEKNIYYVNDGTYGSFVEELLKLKSRAPIALNPSKVERKDKFLSTIWGPTCDAYDFIIKDTLLEEFFIGDWMVWRNMGAYTISLAGDFNGIQKPDVYPFIRKSDLKVLKADIEKAQEIRLCNGKGCK